MISSVVKEEILRDYSSLLYSSNLWMDRNSKELLLIQSIEGHVKEGHCEISMAHPNFTIEDVVLALDKSPDDIKGRRQKEIDDFFLFLKDVIDGKKDSYSKRDGRPLFGYKVFEKHSQISDANALLTGLYLGGLMDDPEIRNLCEKSYHIQLRQGICCLVNRKRLEEEQLSLRDLSHFCYTQEEVEKLERIGVISLGGGPIGGDYTFGYVQVSPGVGTSDDLAILTAGVLYGFDAALGVFLADAVDTWDKYVPYAYGLGQDCMIPEIISQKQDVVRKNVSDNFSLPDEKDILKFVSHIAKSRYRGVRSTSQRYLNQLVDGIAPIDNYLDIVEGRSAYNLWVGPKSIGLRMSTELAVKQLFSRLNRTEKGKLGRKLKAKFKH